MPNNLIKARNKINAFLYQKILRKILFTIDPEKIHDLFTNFGKFLGNHYLTRKLCSLGFKFKNKKYLSQNIHGINFNNPIGLAAGFDKNANLIKIMPEVGFGFTEIGSITMLPYEGNPKPRLYRLKKSRGLVVNYGLKNDGYKKIFNRIKNLKSSIPFGISIAKTNCKKTTGLKEGTKDYITTYQKFSKIGAYDVLNLSCPNAYGGEYFTNPKYLEHLLKKVEKQRSKKPIFLKISPDLSENELNEVIKIAQEHRIEGFICGNLTKNRENKYIKDTHVPAKGGLSGKIVEELSNRLIEKVYKKTKGKMTIIGCGGIFSAKDAYKKIKLGASLLQLITGMIYEGPQLISEINLGLIDLLKKDKLSNISKAIGLYHKKT